jgi:hypothetical protein
LRASKIYPEKSSACNYICEIELKNVKFFDTSRRGVMAKKMALFALARDFELNR